MSDIKFVSLEANVEYASVHKPKKKYKSEDNQYSVTAILDDKAMADFKVIMSEHNIQEQVLNPQTEVKQSRFKVGKDGVKRISFMRDEFKKNGEPSSMPVTDASGKNRIPSDILIGNGSRCVIHFFVYPSVKKDSEDKPKGVFRLSGLQVLDLVPYEGATFEKREGYQAPAASDIDATGGASDTECPF